MRLFRQICFQVHWFIGITAGIILAVVGVTGALLSFEDSIIDALNRDVRTVTPRAEGPLQPAELLARISAAHPEKRITALTVSSEPNRAARVTFAPERSAQGSGRGGRGESRYVDPYTGELIAGAGNRGEGFFRATMQIHRWLMVGSFGDRDIGRQIVGASTLLLTVLALTGLYLRWPSRRVLDWRAWLALNFKQRGRLFIWNLHAVAGTWVLLFYLVMSLTGLYWSYEWYRNGLYALAGVERPARFGPPGPPAGGQDSSFEPVDVSRAWMAFMRETTDTGFGSATLTLPGKPGDPVEIRYLDVRPRHERAFNTLVADPATGDVLRHERYAEKPPGARFMASIFPLHSGSFFGLPGTIVFMIASLAMPLFTVTGWMLYLSRRRRKKAALAERRQAEAAALATGQAGSTG